MADILLCNDDGWESAGLNALAKEIDKINNSNLVIYAPSCEKSWISKMISRYEEIFVDNVSFPSDIEAYSVSGSPSDSCLIGAANILKNSGKKPDLIISGINIGANMGLSFILSSGTIAVSMEAAMMNIPSFSISLFFKRKDFTKKKITKISSFKKAAEFARIMAEKILKKGNYPSGVDFLVVNVPFKAKELDYEITRVAKIHYGTLFKKYKDTSYVFDDKISFIDFKFDLEKNSDVYTILTKNKISVSPISLDITGDLQNLKDYLD
ncbi:MAG: 5'/3'-nucleotidase SurE [Candidatus Lokiarchaeota archaeon]|nr:5'/3'-nucleotidase SurE [Candidatus Lokiarchaeota archaeon]